MFDRLRLLACEGDFIDVFVHHNTLIVLLFFATVAQELILGFNCGLS